jgi:catechol 2,3-dioxygenase-like lactoylglutathione lyase family enzyme
MVRDQDRSLRFYLDQLGFQLGTDQHLPSGERWIVIMPPEGSGLLALIKPPENSEDHQRIGRNTGAIFMTNDIRALFAEWSKRNVRFPEPPVQTPWALQASFEDIDGNRFGLVGS